MRGVAKVSGPKNPKIGETNFYEATEFHKGTVVINPNEIKWVLYEYEDGKWFKLNGPIKTGKKVTFSFPQKWYGKQLLVEAYLFEPEGKSLPGLIVSPVMGEKKIVTAEILNGSGGAITEKPKYGQSITLKVKTDNMLGDTLKLTLWDRDTVGMPEHVSSLNQSLWSGVAKVNDSSGIVQQKVMLSPALRQLANKSLVEGDTHEYYLVVEGNNAIKISQTREVSNEIMLSPNPPPKPKPTPAPPPVVPSAQVPVPVQNGVGTEVAPVGGTNTAVVQGTTVENCEQKYCIKKGAKSELIREINIRLAGFGGNVPTDEFTDRTEKMIKQFQKDYMKITPTGKICGNLLKAIDQFQASINVNFNDIACKCGVCSGYGFEKYSAQYQNTSIAESGRKYEYPGIHRSLLHGYRASIFYLEKDKDLGYKNKLIFSGYRCWINNNQKGRKSTNHMGKAIDIHYLHRNGGHAGADKDVSSIRLNIFNKYLGAQWDWDNGPDIFYLESSAVGATSWIHVDVREFSQQYLKKQYFVKDLASLNGKSIVALATELGFQKTCICNGTGNNSAPAPLPQPTAASGRVDPKTLSTSPKGIEFIKSWEKFEPRLYNDAVGHCTIGYGHLIHLGNCNGGETQEFKNGISQARATELFNSRLPQYENGVRRSITAKLYQHEFDALVSLLFNAGEYFLDVGGAGGGNTQIKIKINRGEYPEGAEQMRDVTNNGLAGLVSRRKSEINMFKNKIYEMHN